MPERTVGPYRVVRMLGAGGMGEVFLAEDTRLHRRVALKAIPSSEHGEASRRLMREARAAARLNHPGIAAVHDVIEQDGRLFIVMEYVDGEPLSALAAAGPLAVARVVEIGIQLTDAVAFAHGHGVVHRDIKPANVMLTTSGHVKLLDLGIARLTEPVPAAPSASLDTTATAMPFAGTPPYMAPELLLGGTATPATDVYSLGVLLYELLTGRRPFVERDPVPLALAIAAGLPPRVEELQRDVPRRLADLVARTMAREPAERPASAARLGAELSAVRAELQDGTTFIAGELPPAPRSWRWIPLGATICTVLALLAWLYVGFGRTPRLPHGPLAVLPAVNLNADPEVDAIGAGLMSILAANLDAAPGLTVVPQSAGTAFRHEGRDLEKAAHELGTPYLIDVAIRKMAGGVSADARIIRAGWPEPLWSQQFSGSLFSVQKGLLGGIATALERAKLFSTRLTDDQREQLRAVPTTSDEALQAYSTGLMQLDTRDSKSATETALDAFERAIRLDPRFALAHAGISEAAGAMYRHTRDAAWLDRATRSAHTAIAIDPSSGHVQYALATVYRSTGRPADARRHVELALRRSPDNEAAHRLLGLLLRDDGKYDEAARSMEQAIALRPDYWLNHHQLGLIFFRAGRYHEAIPAFKRVTELRPDYAGGYQALGTVHHYAGNIDQAIGHYGHAVRIGPSAEALGNLGYTYYVAGRLDDALDMYRRVLDLNPVSASAHRNLGDVLVRIGRVAEGRRSYEQAIGLATAELRANPRDPALIGLVALCEARLGRFDSAIRHSAEALALAPDDMDAVYNRAAVSALAGRADAAVEHLSRALALGYPRQLAKEDEDFANVKKDARYQRLTTGN